MRILLSMPHFPVSTGRFLKDAFARLGHDVKSCGAAHGVHTGWGLDIDERYVFHPDAPNNEQIPGWIPDLVVNLDEYARPLPQRHSAYVHTPHIAYSTSNNTVNLSGANFEHDFIALWNGPAWKMEESDPAKTTWLPCAYCPDVHTPSPIPWENREYDVVFIGAAYTERQVMLDMFRQAGLKVFQDMGLIYDEYVEVYHNSRFGIAHAGMWPAPAMRFYETPAMGVISLCRDTVYEARLDADDSVLWFSWDSYLERVRWYLDNPNEAEALVQRGLEWVKPHTWDARAQTIIEWFEKEYA